MLENPKYDLLAQLNEESKSLWRINEEYLPNAHEEENKELIAFWEGMKRDKEYHIDNLTELLKKYL